MTDIKNILSDMLAKRKDIVKLLFAAFILALGTSLLANYLTSLLERHIVYTLITGCCLIIFVIIYLIISLLNQCNRKTSIEGFLLFKKNNNKSINISRYNFSESVHQTLNSVFVENEALKKHWDNEIKVKTTEIPEKEEKIESETNLSENEKGNISYITIEAIQVNPNENIEITPATRILNEVIEHVIIEKLSVHLSTYFNEFSAGDKDIKEFSRMDFPKILLENRVTNLLSTPFEDRAIFSKFGIDKSSNKGEVISVYGSDGSHYSKFDLVLPKGTEVQRENDGSLKLENKRIRITIKIRNEGYGGSIPRGFEYNYLGIKDDLSVISKKIIFEITGYIKPWPLLFNNGWKYHEWIDSFIKEIEEFSSFEYFLDKINWESNLTNVIILNNRRNFIKEIEKINKLAK